MLVALLVGEKTMSPYITLGAHLFVFFTGLVLSCHAFVVSPRWSPAPPTVARGMSRGMRRLGATPVGVGSRKTTARRASADVANEGNDDDDDDVLVGDVNPPLPDDYYPGEIGYQWNKKNADGTDVDKFTDYPINLPSYLLLCLATVAAIACIGSIFEVIGKHPQLGFTATYIIGTLSLPTFIFLFYASLKKGKAEVEEDDAKYGGGGPW